MTVRRFPLLGKAVALFAVVVAVVLALRIVGGVVQERQGRLREAERSVAASLAAAQTLTGPLVARECVETWEEVQGEGKDRKTVVERAAVVLGAAPATLEIKADATLEPRRRGIFVVNGYVLKARIVATWNDGKELLAAPEHAGGRLACDAPRLVVGLGDARGVRGATVRVDAVATPVLPGTRHPAHRDGFHVDIDPGFAGAARPLAAEIALELVGTGSLDIAPVGERTQVSLASDWPHPSFSGRFLPVEREVGDRGFSARWALTALATSAPRLAAEGASTCGVEAEPGAASPGAAGRCVETFGVGFFDPVSAYVLSDRATKYGLLFIALVFVGVAAVEVLQRVRVHPIQYGLVGAALVVFFLLLVSLSEHAPFAVAYAAAAAASTALLAFYGSFVLGGWRAGSVFGGAIAALFAALFGVLQLEQTALLLGSLLLFAVLAGIMVATRRIDWYAFFESMRAGATRGGREPALRSG